MPDIVYSVLPQQAGRNSITAYTGTAGTTAAFIPAGAGAVWVLTTTAAYVKIGVSPTATNADFPMAANVPVIFQLPENNGQLKVSAVQVASGGNLHVAPLQL